MKPLLLAFGFALLALPSFLFAADDRANGLAAFAASNWKDAYLLLSAAHQSAPSDRDVSLKAYHAAMAYAKDLLATQRHQEALTVCEWASTIDPELVPESFRFLVSHNKGMAELGLGKIDSAIRSFLQAKELSSNPTTLQALGVAYSKKEDWSNAVSMFTQCLRSGGKPDLSLFQGLAHAAYQAGDTGKALEWVRQGILAFPSDPTLLALDAKYRRENRTEERMRESTGLNFDVKFEDLSEQQDLRSKILRALDEAYQSVTRDFSFYPDKNVRVVIYPSSVDFSSGSGAPNWAAANFDGKIRIPVGAAQGSDDSLRRIVTHEFTHFIIDKVSKQNCPAWLHEGLAQVQEKNEKGWASAVLRRYMGHKKTREQMMDLKTLEGSFLSISDPERASLAYAESYLVTKYIIGQYGMFKVSQILEDLAGGSSISDALYGRLAVDSSELQRRWMTSFAEEFHLDW